jgi:hypothetical protein
MSSPKSVRAKTIDHASRIKTTADLVIGSTKRAVAIHRPVGWNPKKSLVRYYSFHVFFIFVFVDTVHQYGCPNRNVAKSEYCSEAVREQGNIFLYSCNPDCRTGQKLANLG